MPDSGYSDVVSIFTARVFERRLSVSGLGGSISGFGEPGATAVYRRMSY
jgi:hypothetical protein